MDSKPFLSRAHFAPAAGPRRPSKVGTAINAEYLGDEESLVRRLALAARLPDAERAGVQARALALVLAVREEQQGGSALDAFLRQYSLASREGVILMCLAEALLRIPDGATADRLIADKIPAGAWSEYLGDSESLLVNASTWGLMLTGKVVALDGAEVGSPRAWYARLAARLGEPIARTALKQAMRILGFQFVMGRDIEEALERADGPRETRYRYSFDMLGEAALTAADAARYFDRYADAITRIGQRADPRVPLLARHGISVKLSALHPRYEIAQRARVMKELAPRLEMLLSLAREHQVALTVDAEEAERLELSIELVQRMLESEVTRDFAGFGLAVQAYQKRAGAVIDWLTQACRERQRQVTLRLVKGAYWDSEIKRAQERGLAGYPVFTRKCNTDVAYLACVRQLAAATDVIFPQFATHNAHTIAYVGQAFAGTTGATSFEFQRLHGMGEELYEHVVAGKWGSYACRVYAPVGAHEDLLPYLVRRLLENGANTSFVNRIVDARLPAEEVVTDPLTEVDALAQVAHPRIAAPAELFGAARHNSRGSNFADPGEVDALISGCRTAASASWEAVPLIGGERVIGGEPRDLVNPAAEGERIGSVVETSATEARRAIDIACAAAPQWDALGGAARAMILERAADRLELHRDALIARCVCEAGKTLPDAAAEVREATDFLRYYAMEARGKFAAELSLPGPTGESNVLRLRGRGVFVCISPWNFPLAIFTGQVAAALAAGNAVIAKPAEQTPLTAALAIQILLAAGVPGEVLHFAPGDGAVGAALTRDPRIAGVAFTGSTETAQLIARELAARDGPSATLIAETGGLNAMIVDSSALAEQVVLDAANSGFNSAGQRCSALRILLLQEEIAQSVERLLAGYMDELCVGDPAQLATDIGPVIDRESLYVLERHAAEVTRDALWQHRVRLPVRTAPGRFFAPLAVELASLDALHREVFGPIVHIVRYRARDLDALVDRINALGYGLTLGIHTRIDGLAQRIARRARVGNVYVNRNMIGAVVGVQPFGGCG
ncbi:MAG TPA: bifunctional proline dehydrogenase/L-glutamate gamma-semialdehyde dehydrogenase PutA, partial [Steroidobacteraceae bacterium]